MNPVVVFDLIALLSALVALTILLTCWKRALPRDARILLAGLLTVVIFHDFCNVLEWSGITAVLDPFEDFVGIFEPMLWGFFLYAFLQDILIRDVRESGNKYRSLYSSMNEGMALHEIIYDESGEATDYRILDVNPAYEHLTGIKREDVIGARASELYGMEGAPYLETYAKVTASKKPVYFETYFESIAKHFKISVFSPADGKFVTLFADITERKKAEEELIRLSNAVKMTKDSITISDLKGNIIDVNEATLKIYGIDDKNDVIGKSSFEFIAPKDRERAFVDMEEVIEKGYAIDKEYRVVIKNGSTIHVEISTAIMKDASGKPIGFVGLTRDITERKQAEEELREGEQKLRAILDVSPDIIHLLDINGIILASNMGFAKRAGLEIDDVVGKCVFDYTPTESVHNKKAAIDKVFRTGEPLQLEDRGLTGIFESHIHPVFNPAGEVTAVAVYARDITERRKTEKELEKHREHLEELVIERTLSLNENEKALVNIVEDLNMTTEELKNANLRLQELDRLKSMFIASTSHELRTPLNSIIGFTSILIEGWSGELTPEQEEQLQIVNTSGKHLLSLINDIIDISKIEAGKLEIYIEEFSLRDVVDEAVSLIVVDVEDKGLTLTVDVPEVTMTTDRRRLLQCIINLLSNAVNFTEKGSITLTAKTINDNIDIFITDTGIGIKREDMQKLFTPFTRLESPLTQKTSGTGLGLYLTKKLAEEVLGGTVDMRSEYEIGSTFALHIPVKQEVRK